ALRHLVATGKGGDHLVGPPIVVDAIAARIEREQHHRVGALLELAHERRLVPEPQPRELRHDEWLEHHLVAAGARHPGFLDGDEPAKYPQRRSRFPRVASHSATAAAIPHGTTFPMSWLASCESEKRPTE